MHYISFQTHYGEASTMSVRGKLPTNDLDSYEGRQISRSDPTIPSVRVGSLPALEKLGSLPTLEKIAENSKSNTFFGMDRDANSKIEKSIANIIDIIEGMDDEASNKAKNKLTKNQQSGIEQLYRVMEWATMTVDDVVEDLKAGTFGGSHREPTARGLSMQAALINGTAKVVDMEEFGYRTEASFNVHFDGAGNFYGSSTSFQRGDDFDLNAFYAEHLIQQPDGRVIDGETGHNSNRIQIGGLDIFITWP